MPAPPAPPTLSAPALAFAAGIGGYFLQTRPPSWPLLAALAMPALLLALLALPGCQSRRWGCWPQAWSHFWSHFWSQLWPHSWPRPRLRRWATLPLAALLGCVWAHLAACPLLCEPLPEAVVGRDLLLTGRIAALPQPRGQATRLLLTVESLTNAGEPVPLRGRVRLNWYRDAPPLRAGERWQLPVRLRPPHGFQNPGGFDYERWLFQQRISATGYVLQRGERQRLAAGAGRFWLTRARQGLQERLQAALGPGLPLALVQALVLGERGALTPAQWEVLARTGTSHLLAISGLHVGLIAGLVFLLVRRLWAQVPPLALRLAAPRAAALATLPAALAYSALAGFAISTQRALVMLAVLLVALLAGRTLRPWAALRLALVAVLLLDPAGVLSVGLWLSFGAVAVLLYALGQRLGPAGWWGRWGAAQWAVSLGLLPLLLLLFGRASLIAPLVNLVAVPLFTLGLPLVLLAALVSLVSDWSLPLVAVGAGLGGAFAALERISDWPWAALALGGRPTWVWAAALAGVVLWLAPRGLPGRWLGAVLLAPLLLVRPPAPPPGSAWLTLLDVGQGLAVVVRTANHSLVYDVGPRFPSGFNTGAAVVAPYLREVGVALPDRVIISHADLDHAGGLRGLYQALPGQPPLWSGEPERLLRTYLDPELAAAVGLAACRAGQSWVWDGVEFELLHPDGDQYRGNDASCVLRVGSGAASLLLTGDIETPVERQLAARAAAGQGPALQSSILVAGHHGSATSSSAAFLDAVAPALILYSAGYANRFGHPAAAVRARVAARGLAELNTADSGAIRIVLDPHTGIGPPQRWRLQADRLWRHHPPPLAAPAAADR